MIRLGLIGYPLEHSLSPDLHRAALQASDLEGEYALYPVMPGDGTALADLVNCIRTGKLQGLNVTIPHKQAVIPFLDELTPAASAIGAANTLYLKDGKVFGDNTDAPGFLADLAQFQQRARSAIVLGAGGSARAVIHALGGAGCEIIVAARRIEQARELMGRFTDTRAVSLSIEALLDRKPQLIVNATPVGMFPDVNKSPWPAGLAFPENAAVYDLIYNPRETQLVRQARAAGLETTTGLGMLVEQAALAFELWTGRKIGRGLMLSTIGHHVH